MPVIQAAMPDSPSMGDDSGHVYGWDENILEDCNQVVTIEEDIWMLNPEVRRK